MGRIDWQTEVSGFCKCPGETMHTSANGKKDCRVNVDWAPTIFCFHASCAVAVAEANRRLRRELGASDLKRRLAEAGGAAFPSFPVIDRFGFDGFGGFDRAASIERSLQFPDLITQQGRLFELEIIGRI